MKFPAALHRRLHLLNLPGALLMMLLQRTPLLNLFVTAENTVLRSPAGAVLKSSVAGLITLGALHSRAGATQLVTSVGSPLRATVGTAIPTVALGLSGTQTSPSTWSVSGVLAPGLKLSGQSTLGTFGGSTLSLTGTPTTAGTFTLSISGSDAGFVSPDFSYTVIVSGGTIATAPSFTTQPAANTTALAGATVTFTVAADGSPAPALQWRKNGAALAGQTTATLTLNAVQAADAGSYTCVATNSAGTATSNAAALTVNAVVVGTAPIFTTQPQGKTIATGSTMVFTTVASGLPAPTYQWRQNGIPISGATLANLVLVGTTTGQAGVYTCVATSSAGTATSSSATLTVQATADAGRIDNLSVLTTLAAGEPYFTVGTVIGGAGTNGTKSLLVRAAGPTLGAAPFSIGGTLPDPKLDFFSGQTVVATNDNWGTPVGSGAASATALSAAFTTRQAFPFISTTSKDAAVFNPAIAAGSYTVQVSDAVGGTGLVIAELYDNTSTAFTATTPRLVNVSVLKVVPTGGLITLGFNIGGSTARTVLIRAMGPTLAPAPFNVPNVMADPKLDLFPAGANTPSASNDNWGGDAQVLTINNTVTFAPLSTTSKDAILLITLPPGGYTVQVSPATGTAGGNVIAEVYEIP